ncbi:MAG: hypothetical protein IAF38_15685 [Bacteroidia bacterium]|nr:hypothetical protein [Bacteroidia bacterium]
MKELKKILLFIVLLSVAVLAADRLFGFVLEKMFQSNYTGQSGGKINYYLRPDYEPELLIMGDSRAQNQVNPDSFKINSFNISHAGMNDVFQECLLDLLLTKKKKPKYILLHIDPSYYTASSDDIEKAVFLKAFYNQAPLLTNYINERGSYEKFKFFFITYRFNSIALNTANNYFKSKEKFTNGFEAIPASSFDSIRTISTAKAQLISKEELPVNTELISRLQRMADACKKNNTRLILFTGPVFYQRNMAPYKKVVAALDSICAKNNISYLRYDKLGEEPEFKTTFLWNDCFHLNDRGQKIFSGIIAKNVYFLINAYE